MNPHPRHWIHIHIFISVFLAICPCVCLSHISFLLLCALKLTVMLRVVCQSWWWICLWVEKADFPWVVSLALSLPLLYSLSSLTFLALLYAISLSNRREPLCPHFPLPALSTPAGCFRRLMSWFNSNQCWAGGVTDHWTYKCAAYAVTFEIYL